MAHFLIDSAEKARNHLAYSYRDFRVGCAMYVTGEGGKSGVISSGNYKPEQEHETICAEDAGILKLRETKGLNRITALAVSGDFQQSDYLKGDHNALLCCEPCSSHFASSPEVSDDTHLFFKNPKTGKIEYFTNGAMQEMVKTGERPIQKVGTVTMAVLSQFGELIDLRKIRLDPSLEN